MNNKIHGQRRKPRFQPMGLIFYCYLLIPLNELALNVLKINKLKIRKKIIDISMVSIQDAGKGIFNYELQITNYKVRLYHIIFVARDYSAIAP